MLSLLEKLRSSAETAASEADAATQRANAAAIEAKLAAQRATNLQKDVDRANEILKTADEQAEFYVGRAAELRANADTIWGRSDLFQGVTICSSPIYTNLAGALAAIEDYKRVRPLLVAQVEAAESALAEFAEANTI